MTSIRAVAQETDTTHYDAIVVGSGPAGSFAAMELTAQGLSILVLEAGRSVAPQEMEPKPIGSGQGGRLLGRIKATLSGQHIQARHGFFVDQLKRFVVNDWLHPYTTPKDAPFLWVRGRQVGGRQHIYGRVLFRWSDYDFKGANGGKSRINWPLSYADLAPWYEKAERFLGVEGNPDHVPTAPDGVMVAPTPLTREEQGFRDALAQRWPERRVVAWRFARHDQAAIPSALAQALATGRATIRSDAIAVQVLTDSVTGRATGVEYADRRTRARHVVRARAVVVCASPIESVRLLLNSRSARHPHGLGNNSGQLGRHFMDQCFVLIHGRWPAKAMSGEAAPLPTHPFYGVTGGFYIPRYANIGNVVNPSFQRGYSYQGSIGRRTGEETDGMIDMWLASFGEMPPYADNRITLNPRRKDRWGVPLPHIRCAVHENERTMLRQQIHDGIEMIECRGGHVKFWGSPLGLGDKDGKAFATEPRLKRWLMRYMFPKSMVMGAAVHESGGARMGTDPADSVLNGYGQCWEAPNVLVTDASSFPTGGTLGTTLTVMALTMRACAHLAEQLKSGHL